MRPTPPELSAALPLKLDGGKLEALNELPPAGVVTEAVMGATESTLTPEVLGGAKVSTERGFVALSAIFPPLSWSGELEVIPVAESPATIVYLNVSVVVPDPET